MKKLVLLLAFLGLGAACFFRIHSLSEKLAAPVSAQTGANCSLIGNNTAVPFGQGGDFNEASHTLALLTGEESVQPIIDLINGSSGTVIVRLGAGKDAPGPADASVYAGMLKRIAAAVGGKNFVATAGHNEPNCAEPIPYEAERAYVSTVATMVTEGNVTLITGQIDHYCGDNSDAVKQQWIEGLSGINGIEGLALPFYITSGTPTAPATVEHFNKWAAFNKSPAIYVTESGPFLPNSMEQFTEGVQLILASNSSIRAFLLFNAFGVNPDGAFSYTKPFWSAACREAFRTQCNSPEKVLEICGNEDLRAHPGYYLYDIKNLHPEAGAPPDRAIGLFNELIDQGYQAQCTTPRFTAAAKRGDDWARFLELVKGGQLPPLNLVSPDGTGSPNVNTSYVYSLENAKVPLFRDQPPTEPALRNSIEDYFGFRETTQNVAESDDYDFLVNSAPIYGILTLQQQCEQKIKLLETTKVMCEQLQNPNECALYQPIPGYPQYNSKSFLEAFHSSGLTCEQVANPNNLSTNQEQL